MAVVEHREKNAKEATMTADTTEAKANAAAESVTKEA
jgi:hypothetical protein